MSDKILNDIDKFITETEADFFNDLASLIKIPSVKGEPVGEKIFGANCGAVLDKALEIGDKYGFRTQNHEYYCGSILFGEGAREEIGIVTHIDVVPAGDGWNYQPFELTEKDELYIGRGTSDDKGPMVAALYAMRYLKDKGYKLPFDVRLIMGCDEESGMTDLPYFLKTMKPPRFSFTPDSEYPVCIGEKGIAEVDILLGELGEDIVEITGGAASNAVADKARIVLSKEADLTSDDNVTITRNDVGNIVAVAAGIAKHAAYPEGSKNAISILAQYLCDNGVFEKDSKEHRIFSFLTEALPDNYGKHFGIEMSDDESGKLTCIGGIIKTIGKKLYLNINIRYPVTKIFEAIFESLTKTMAAKGFVPTLLYDKAPYYRSPDSKEVIALMSAFETVTGRDDKPYTTGGGTYARAFPNCVAFGVGFTDDKTLLGESRGGPHERDEYISKQELFDSVKIFVLSLLNL